MLWSADGGKLSLAALFILAIGGLSVCGAKNAGRQYLVIACSEARDKKGPQGSAYVAFALPRSTASAVASDKEEWVSLFNGRNLNGWTPKITHHDLGENVANTFRVEDGLLKVRYDQYEKFDGQFGHLFYDTPYSHYRLVVEYRFVGEQAPGGPGRWALRNSGAMLHSQDPLTMQRDQNFPVSIEAQFLGGLSDGKPRPTMNVCSPGTDIVYQGTLYPQHCLSSSSKTVDGDRWVRAEMLVLGSERITHFVDGEKVLEYSSPQYEDKVATNYGLAGKVKGEPVADGYIALQSESHPIDIRKVEVLNLAGCMDRIAMNYKSYYVKSVPDSCVFGVNAAAERIP